MRYAKAMFLMRSLSAVAAAAGRDASACGGCFTGIQETESTQVTGHRMILSVSKDATTLWDQIQYAGDPQSFAWVLPIQGKVDIATSSDELFQALEQMTQLTVASPTVYCGNA